MMDNVLGGQCAAFAAAAHRVASTGLVRCSSGNLSWRIDDKRMLITPTRSWMEELTADNVAICRIEDGSALDDKIPSVEAGFHAGILRERPDMHVVLHCQSPYATAIACLESPPSSFDLIPEIPFHIGAVACVPYAQPGSRGLVDTVIEAARKHDLVILRNHGQVVVGTDFRDAIQKASFFELACEIVLRTQRRAKPMAPDFAKELRRLHETHRAGKV